MKNQDEDNQTAISRQYPNVGIYKNLLLFKNNY